MCKVFVTNQSFSRVSMEAVVCVESSLTPSAAKVVNQMVNVQSIPAGILSIHSVDVGAVQTKLYSKNLI